VIAAVNCVALTTVVVRAVPFHCAVVPLPNPLPVSVNVNAAPPAVALVGEIAVSVGPPAAIGKVSAAEVPPPGVGVTTVTDTLAAVAMSVALMAAVSCVALTTVVVRALPFQFTVEPFTKLLPVTVSVNAAPPATAPAGLKLVSVGAGLLTEKVSAAEVPPPGVGVKTVTGTLPPVAMSAVVMPAVSCVALTNVVVRALPFQRTVEPLTKLVPVTVSVKAGPPAVALVDDNAVSVGTGLLPTTPVPLTVLEMLPLFAVKVTLPVASAATVGVNRTVTVAVAPLPTRLNEPPDTTLNGADVVALPDTVPPPVFCTVKVWSAVVPMLTLPKSTVPLGVTEKSLRATALPTGEQALSAPLESTAVTAAEAASGHLSLVDAGQPTVDHFAPTVEAELQSRGVTPQPAGAVPGAADAGAGRARERGRVGPRRATAAATDLE